MTRLAVQAAAVALGLAVASASVVVRQAEEECRGVGVRCAGAPGQPFVPYDMCCDGLSCMGAGTEYGLFCIDVENPGEFTVSSDAVPAADGVATDGADDETSTVAPDATTAAPAETVTGAADDDGTTVVSPGADTNGTTEEPTVTATGGAGSSDDDSTADASSEEDDGTTTIGGAAAGDDDDDNADASDEEDGAGGLTGSTGSSASASDEEDDDDITGRADASDEDDGDSVCFPAAATVELENGQTVSMDSLSIGDVVKVGVNEYSRVFMFTHKMAGVTHKFVTLETESGASLSLTEGHYLYANGALVAAKTVNVGDVLTLGNGESSPVVAVGSTSSTGLFNPQTVNGNVVVDGVLASTYTTAVEPTFAHAVLAPFRMLNNFGLQFTALESGGGVFAGVAPRGQAAF